MSFKKSCKEVGMSALIASSITASLFCANQLSEEILPKAKADVVSGCEDLLWIMPFQSTRRAICDGVRRPDGSWLRSRVHYTPRYYKPLTTNCYGSSFISCTTTGGYWVDYNEFSSDQYIVFDSNVLPTEPGHLENNNR